MRFLKASLLIPFVVFVDSIVIFLSLPRKIFWWKENFPLENHFLSAPHSKDYCIILMGFRNLKTNLSTRGHTQNQPLKTLDAPGCIKTTQFKLQ